MLQHSDLQVMEIRSQDGKTAVIFEVDPTQLDSPPSNAELFFHRYGNHEYLSRIFQSGSADGSRVILSRSEMSMQNDGSKPRERSVQGE